MLLANAITAAALTLGAVLPDNIDRLTGMLDGYRPDVELVNGGAKGVLPAQPSPELAPADVVRITLEALKANDRPYPNAGIEIAYTFSSPDNRESSGPLDKFAQLVHGDVYGPMLNHQSARFGALEVDGNDAWLPVVVVSEQAERYGFMFRLTRQLSGSYAGCWMVEGVFPFEVEDVEEPRLLVTA